MSKEEDNASDDSALVAKRIVETILREGHLPPGRSESSPALKISTGPLITAQVGQTVIVISEPEKLAELLLQRIKECAGSSEWAIRVNDDEQWLQSEMLTERSIETLATTAMTFFINNLAEKLKETLNEHIDESLMLTQRGHEKLFVEGMVKSEPNLQIKISESATNAVDAVMKRATEAKKARLLRPLMLIDQIGEPRWHEMKAHYEELLPLAQDAKNVYETNKTRDWRAMIKAGFPQFDESLITLLSDDPDDIARLSPELQKAVENNEYSRPSNFALEQAARRCGMKPCRYTPRTLRERMDESEALKSAGQDISTEATPSRKRKNKKVSLETIVSLKTH